MKKKATHSLLVASAAVVVAALLLLDVASISAGGPAANDDRPPAAAFAGSGACAECHPDIYDEWAGTGHARTLREAWGDESLPPVVRMGGTVLHPPGRTRFIRGESGYSVETVGADGSDQVFPLTHVVGVRRVLMFLSRMADGRLQVLPGMLDRTTGDWFDYSHLIFGVPGADPMTPPIIRPGEPSVWTGMQRFFDARCARCHTSGWEFVAAREGPRSRYRAAGVDCEQCHGPAAGHVAYWAGGSEPAPAVDPILAVGGLTREGSASVCLGCHMEGEVVDHGFTPGGSYFDHFDPTLLDDRERVDADGRALELIYDGLPYFSSVCAGEGELTCVTCHAPHGTGHRAQLRTHPKDPALCAKCHEDVVAAGPEHTRHSPGGEGASCVGCHMPFLTIERGHGAVTDHTIGIPRPEAGADRRATDACTGCHTGARGAPGGVPRLSRDRIAGAYRNWWPDPAPRPDWAAAIEAGRVGGPEALAALIAAAGNEETPRIARASAVRLMGRFPTEAARDLLRLAADPDDLVRRNAIGGLAAVPGEVVDAVLHGALLDDSAAVRRRAAEAAIAGWDRVTRNRSLLDALIPVLEERTDLVPEDDRAWFLLGAARQIAGDLRGAIEAYEGKLALDPYARLVRETVVRLRALLAESER